MDAKAGARPAGSAHRTKRAVRLPAPPRPAPSRSPRRRASIRRDVVEIVERASPVRRESSPAETVPRSLNVRTRRDSGAEESSSSSRAVSSSLSIPKALPAALTRYFFRHRNNRCESNSATAESRMAKHSPARHGGNDADEESGSGRRDVFGDGRRGLCRTQDQHAASMVGRLRRGGDRQARRDVHGRGRQVGADLDRRPHRQHARQAARRRRRRQRAAGRAAQGSGNRRMERDRHDRQPRRARQGGRLGQGRRARTAARDEADRRLGRGADEHPPHQLAVGLDSRAGRRPASRTCRRTGPSSMRTATRSSPPA